MAEDLVKYDSGVTALIEQQKNEIRKFIAPNLTEGEFWMFIQTAKANDLNPLKREVYPVKYQDRLQIITGYEVYIKRANLSKLLEWWKVEIKKPSDDFKTWIGVFTAKRLDWTREFEWEVPMVECYKNQATWQTMKEFMLKKTTIGQGLRLLISEVLAGMPYIAEELGSQVTESDYTVIPEEQKIEPEPSEQEAKDKAKNEFLNKLMVALSKKTTIKDLDATYTKSKPSYDQSVLIDSINAMYATRRKQLTIETLQELTNAGFGLTNIDDWMAQTGDVQIIIDEALAGNKDAIKTIELNIQSFLELQKKPEPEVTEPNQEELDLANMADARASE